MEIPNFDPIVNQVVPRTAKLQNASWAPQHHFRWLVVGPSGSGKTNAVLHALLNGIKFDRLYLYAKDLMEGKYIFLQKLFNSIEEASVSDGQKDKIPIMHVGNKTSDIIPVDDLNRDLTHVVIFDDFILEKNQESMLEYFVRGRKQNCSMIYISQSYFDVPKTIRLNCNYFSIYEVPTRNELTQLCKDHCAGVSFDEFQGMYKKATNDRHSFLLIDKVSNVDIMKFRKNFIGVRTPF